MQTAIGDDLHAEIVLSACNDTAPQNKYPKLLLIFLKFIITIKIEMEKKTTSPFIIVLFFCIAVKRSRETALYIAGD